MQTANARHFRLQIVVVVEVVVNVVVMFEKYNKDSLRDCNDSLRGYKDSLRKYKHSLRRYKDSLRSVKTI